MKRRMFFLPVLVAGIAIAVYAYREYNRKNEDLLKAKTVLSIDAGSLISAYEQDQAQFNQKYTDKVITVKGTIKKIDDGENPVVLSLGDANEFSSVQCSMDSSHANMYTTIKEGQPVSLKGVVTGGRTEEMFGTDIILNRCVVKVE